LLYLITATQLDASYRNLSLSYNIGNEPSCYGSWSITETCSDKNYEQFLKEIDDDDCSTLVMYIFSNKSFPENLSYISEKG
jgi:hypothetical protein